MVQTAQQRAKKWKALESCGCLTALAGSVVIITSIAMIARAAKGLPQVETVAAITVALGLAGYVAGGVGGW